MQINKILVTVALVAACLSAVTVNGFAHSRRQYADCPQQNCTSTELHHHDGVTYRANPNQDSRGCHTQNTTYGGHGCRRIQ